MDKPLDESLRDLWDKGFIAGVEAALMNLEHAKVIARTKKGGPLRESLDELFPK